MSVIGGHVLERAARVLAGGADSPVRTGHAVGGEPFVQGRGEGAYAFDELGRRYIDYIMAYGPLLFGHAHPAICRDLDAIALRGTIYGSTHEEEVRLAERIRHHLPSMQRLRFTSTGTEAVMSAIRIARAFTGRNVIIKFAGNYHGHSDLALHQAGASANTLDAARSGIPHAITADMRVARYNDLDDVDRILAQERVAAIIVEPVAANMGLVVPAGGFLDGLRERTHRMGCVLIFDEVITWLRLGLGGAQTHMNVQPDLTTLGKVMGGGFPIAAFGGRTDVMSVLAPEGLTFTGGTHSGNPFCVALAHRVIDLLEAHPEYYWHMSSQAQRLARGIKEILGHLALPYYVAHLESIVDFKFRAGATRNYEDACAADRDLFAAYYHAMRRRAVLLAPSQNEVMFLSTAHTAQDVDTTLAAMHDAFAELRAGRVL